MITFTYPTVKEVIEEVDELKPNTFTNKQKVTWINEVTQKIFLNLDLSRGSEDNLKTYSENKLTEKLTISKPYNDLVRYYLFAMIDLTNGETERYQNSMVAFNTAYRDYSNYYCRTYKHI